jgi:hypothetical protein
VRIVRHGLDSEPVQQPELLMDAAASGLCSSSANRVAGTTVERDTGITGL